MGEAKELAGAQPEAVHKAKGVLLVRRGRGRVGGSTTCRWAIERARHHGRRVKPLDGDLRSGTLARLYAAAGGVADPVSVPAGEDPALQRRWLLGELDAMAEDGVSRVVDLGGGEQVVQDLVRDIALPGFCEAVGIHLVPLFILGPDPEDFRHVTQIIGSGDLDGARPVLVLNEGVVRQGQTTAGVFAPIIESPDLAALERDGARMVKMNRLACMDALRDAGLGFYEAAFPAERVKVSATIRHMTAKWCRDNEAEHEAAGTTECLP